MEVKARKDIKTRANQIAGQFTGMQHMIEEDRYCVDILNQIAAVRFALGVLGIKLLSEHLESCRATAQARPRRTPSR